MGPLPAPAVVPLELQIVETEQLSRLQRVVSLDNVRVTLPTGGGARRVFTLVQPRTIQPRAVNDNALQFVSPRIGEYEAVVIEK